MKRVIGMCIAVLLSSAAVTQAEDSMSSCSALADIASLAVEAKNSGMSFVEFGRVLDDSQDVPQEAANMMKSVAAVAYENFDSPAGAYSGLLSTCLKASKS